MLRESRESTASATSRPAARLATMFAVAVLAVGVAGVRQVASGQSAPDVLADSAPAGGEGKFEKVPRIGLEVVPEDAISVFAVRPAEVFSQPAYRDLTAKVDEVMPPIFSERISIRDIAEVMLIFHNTGGYQPRYVLRFTRPEACAAYIEGATEEMPRSPEYDIATSSTWSTDDQRITKLDELTAIFDQIVDPQSLQQTFPPIVKQTREWDEAWIKAADSQVAIALDVAKFHKLLQGDAADMNMLAGGPPMQMFAPLVEGTNWCVASVDMMESLSINALAECKNEASAKSVAATSQAAKVLFGNLAEQQRAAAKQQMLPGMAAYQGTIDSLFDLVAEFSADAQIVAEGDEVKLTFTSKKMDADKVAIATGLLMPAVEAAREAARRTQSMNNMKQILLAMHNYEATYKRLPPAVVYETLPDGTKVGRSWRVELLPFFSEADLYQQYRKDEPWDSEANKKVLAKMPAVFRAPSDDPTSTNSGYFVLTGPTTLFPGEKVIQFKDVPDGLSNTIALVDAKRDIPWTKPEGIAYDPAKPLPEFGGRHPGVFLAGIADGSVQPIAHEFDQQTLRLMIERADGNAIDRVFTEELLPQKMAPAPPQ